MPASILDLDSRDAAGRYARWRDAKLATLPASASELIVEVGDPRALTATERGAMAARLRRANMVIYASPILAEDKAIPVALGRQFGLSRLDGNRFADEDQITRIAVDNDGSSRRYIPYTTRAMNWHTDGYYNDPARPIHAMLLHCVRPAAHGGENDLLDHEIAYIRMREQNPDFVRAMMAANAMTIPALEDDDGVARPTVGGPVFSMHARSGRLHMRFTARTRSVAWADNPATRAAAEWLLAFLRSDEPAKVRVRLEAGMGLLCANVLHNRASFDEDPAAPRLLYRARYFDEINTAAAHVASSGTPCLAA
jgi:alpha-ketoglutarate-dependent taurine dioxygenase